MTVHACLPLTATKSTPLHLVIPRFQPLSIRVNRSRLHLRTISAYSHLPSTSPMAVFHNARAERARKREATLARVRCNQNQPHFKMSSKPATTSMRKKESKILSICEAKKKFNVSNRNLLDLFRGAKKKTKPKSFIGANGEKLSVKMLGRDNGSERASEEEVVTTVEKKGGSSAG